jgi:hypothetical protein
MYFSKRLNLLFIAAPKSGSTTVENTLLTIDPNGERFRITLEDREIDSSSVAADSLGHATALELRKSLGADRYNSLRTFGFVRHPIERLSSTYFFTRQRTFQRIFRRKARSKLQLFSVIAKGIVTTLFAKGLPFSLWAFLFPMKKCSDYFLDDSGRIIVDILGSTDRLSEDLKDILAELDIPANNLDVPHLNKSIRSRGPTSIRPAMLYNFLAKRYADDIFLYSLVEKRIHDNRH